MIGKNYYCYLTSKPLEKIAIRYFIKGTLFGTGIAVALSSGILAKAFFKFQKRSQKEGTDGELKESIGQCKENINNIESNQ